MDGVMTRELQIYRLKELFRQFNPGEDIQEIDFEAYIDPDLPLPGNIALMESYYPLFVWRKEELLEEMISPEMLQMREERLKRIELEKERKEHLERIRVHEQKLRREVESVVSEEIGALKEELEDLKAQRVRIPQAQPAELEEMRKDVGRTAERLHEMDLLLMSTYKKLRYLEKERGEIRPSLVPTREEIMSPELLQSRLAQIPIFPSFRTIQYWDPKLRKEFYPWWEDIPCKIAKGIHQRQISMRNFIELGIPPEWVDRQIELCREEYRRRGMSKEASPL